MAVDSKLATSPRSVTAAWSVTAWLRLLLGARSIVLAALALLVAVTSAQAAAVTVKVVSARTEPQAFGGTGVSQGALVPNYKYLINIDNSGQTTQRSPNPGTGCNPADAGYPNSCKWTSIAGAPSSSPIFTQGDQADFASPMDIPDGRYLISVLAEGYKLDGRHFKITNGVVSWEGKSGSDPASEVLVELQPTPIPDAQIQAAVFEDVSPVNGAPDLPAEHGLAGFQGHIVDYLGEVTTDVYGQPLCGSGRCLSKCYAVSNGVDVGTVAPIDAVGRCPVSPTLANGSPRPLLEGGTVPAGASIEGKVKIPNLGTNRYSLSVTPPDGSGWVQTTTLEGNHDWDAWVMEGATGLDTEFIIAGEPFPAIIFGYVPAPGTPSATGSALPPSLNGSGTIKGVVDAVKLYIPTAGGVGGFPGDIFGGLQGAKIDKPIAYPWITLTDLDNGDTVVWVGQGDANGQFTIPHVPSGNYSLTWWDEPQNEILDLVNVTVGAGETVDMGVLPLAGWWTFFDGYVYNDTNRNGVKDPGEPGLAGYTLTMRKRENSLMDRGSTSATTDADGYYKFEAGYPMTQWLVMEAYDDLHYTTGVTYQADNQTQPTTILGAGVDVSVHPVIGLSGHMDWGKHSYDPTGANGIDPRNGGIVGTVSYDTTRNELDPRYAAVEDWQPSISNLPVKLYKPVLATLPCVRLPAAGATCDSTGRYAVGPDGSLTKGQLLNSYLSETWQRPKGCIARDVDGNQLRHGVDEKVLSTDDVDGECIEAPMLGVQFAPYATDQGTPDANFGATVDGNYGFGDACINGTLDATDPSAPTCKDGTGADVPFTTLAAGDYLVHVEIPNDVKGRALYKVTREEDINIGNGDQFVPPAVPPPPCAGALHVVDSSGNANFPGGPGTSPYEGQSRPLCDMKLVTLSNGKSVAPAFNLYTDVPLPGRHWFIIIDDLNVSTNPKSTTYSEKAGIPFVPVGIYDWTDRLVTTVESDYNGLADVLLPSTNRINCPTPSGVCSNLYRYVGNDPGVPGHLNLNFNPSFRTIAAEFEVFPGLLAPADLAPTQVGVAVQLPGGQTTSPVSCKLDDQTPELYAVNVPYAIRPAGAATVPITIKGKGFGATQGAGRVSLDNAAPGIASWSDTQIVFNLSSAIAYGPHQLSVTAGNGQRTVNGLAFHVVLGGGSNDAYNPRVFEVGPGKTYAPAETLPAAANHAIQRALDDATTFVAASNLNANRGALVVVYPNNPSANPRQNPRGAYYENLILTSRVKLQGVGPGSPNGSVKGSIIDGGAFAGDSPVATDWYTRIARETVNGVPTWGGNATIYDGAVISIYVPAPTGNPNTAASRRAFPTAYNAATAPSIDGFDLRGGDQAGFPANINEVGGTPTGLPPGLITQGGAVFANAYARNLQITNNVVQNNGGAYGTIRIGTPDLTGPDVNNHNESVVVAYNRVIANAGTNQAGGIGIFNGADNYQVAHNDICGNFSAEYGGGISAIGRSPGGSINNNRIYFNEAYDEGGGILIGGALPANPATLSPGSGPVSIYNNLIQANLANDDGGGIRFLMAGNFPMNVFNNFIVNNVSAHEGGGIALNDAPNVRFVNNTVMKNLTTATAATSNGATAPAGLSTSLNSDLLRATLPAGSPVFSNPLLFNNIFWDNRAGTRNLADVTGLSDADANHWDMGVADGSGQLSPTNSVLQSETVNHSDVVASATNVVDQNPQVVKTIDIPVTFQAWRNNPAFLGAILISADLPPNLLSDYHLAGAGSPAYNRGAASKAVPGYQAPPAQLAAPGFDIDNQTRPQDGGFDAGADEVAAAPQAIAGVSPTSLAYGNHVIGSNTDQSLTLSNTGNATLTGIAINVTGAGFARNGGSCGATLNANTTCTIVIRFTPTAATSYSGSVAIAASVPVTNAPVALSGTGTPAPGTVAFTGESGPATLIGPLLLFGNQTGNVTDTLAITIGGGTPVTFGTATVANGGGQTAFGKGTDTCSGTTKAPGSTCTISVNFNGPAGTALRTGSLTVPHNGSNSPAVLGLTGS